MGKENKMDVSCSTAIMHLALMGSSAWSIKNLGTGCGDLYDYKWVYGTFGLMLLHSSIGIIRFVSLFGCDKEEPDDLSGNCPCPGHPKLADKVKRMYRTSSMMTTFFCFPLYTTELYLMYKMTWELSLLHMATVGVPMVEYMMGKRHNKAMFCEINLAVHCLAVAYLGSVTGNYDALASALCYAANVFVIGLVGEVGDTQLPAIDLFTIGLCFFNWFAVRALNN